MGCRLASSPNKVAARVAEARAVCGIGSWSVRGEKRGHSTFLSSVPPFAAVRWDADWLRGPTTLRLVWPEPVQCAAYRLLVCKEVALRWRSYAEWVQRMPPFSLLFPIQRLHRVTSSLPQTVVTFHPARLVCRLGNFPNLYVVLTRLLLSHSK